MIVHATADLHGNLPAIPHGDLLIIAGDIVPLACHKPRHAWPWLNTEFRAWLEALPVKKVVAIWGNHDFVGQRADMVPPLPWTLLERASYTFGLKATGETVKIWGSPWTPFFNDWAFNTDEETLEAHYKEIPADTDILVVHGPPFGILDETPDHRHVGSPALRAAIDRVKPKLVVFGHVHHAFGVQVLPWERGRTVLHNVALCDEKYQPTRPVVMVMK